MRKEDYEALLTRGHGRIMVNDVCMLELTPDGRLLVRMDACGPLGVKTDPVAVEARDWESVRADMEHKCYTALMEATARQTALLLAQPAHDERITLAEYARRTNHDRVYAYRRAERGDFKSAQKVGRVWYIDANEPWPDDQRKTAGGQFSRAARAMRGTGRHTSLSKAFYDRIREEKHIKTARAEYKYESGKYYRLDVIDGVWEEI